MNRRLFTFSSLAIAAAFALGACSEKEAVAATPTSTLTPQQIYELAAKGNGFTVGVPMAANTVYVFFDTTCPHCAQLWSSSKPLLGKLKIVWMPIGLLRQTSGPQGATILAAADPAAAMALNEAAVLDRKGGIPVDGNLSDAVLAKVKANTDMFMKMGAESVPLIVFRNSKSGQYGQHAGAVDAATLAALVGL